MPNLRYTRNDIESLAARLASRASTLAVSNPQLSADVVTAARLLRWMLSKGMPPDFAEVENGGPHA